MKNGCFCKLGFLGYVMLWLEVAYIIGLMTPWHQWHSQRFSRRQNDRSEE
jgi:hypothetical protein